LAKIRCGGNEIQCVLTVLQQTVGQGHHHHASVIWHTQPGVLMPPWPLGDPDEQEWSVARVPVGRVVHHG